MTYSVGVETKAGKATVKVDAASEEAAKEIASWLVQHSQHLYCHVPSTLPKSRTSSL
jgi:hypothetical protein